MTAYITTIIKVTKTKLLKHALGIFKQNNTSKNKNIANKTAIFVVKNDLLLKNRNF